MKTKMMKLSDIVVEQMDEPKNSKIKRYEEFLNNFGAEELLKVNPIVVRDNKLIDGYCTYKLLQKANGEYATVQETISSEPVYKVVEAVHLRRGKESEGKCYRWQYAQREPVLPEDLLLVRKGKNLIPIRVKRVLVLEQHEVAKYKRVANVSKRA